MYVLYVYVYLFLENAKLQPSTSKIALSLSLFLFVSFMFLHLLTSNMSTICFLWDKWCRDFSVIKGVWGSGLAGGRVCKDSITTPMHEVFFFFLPILIIKLDNCTVLMTSSNMLSIINVTKSNLDIKCVHQWHTAMLFHCLFVWTCFFFFLFVWEGAGCVRVPTEHRLVIQTVFWWQWIRKRLPTKCRL